MKIAMVVRSFSTDGGLELYTYKLVDGLLNLGHSVTVICEEDKSGLVHDNLSVKKFAPAAKGLRKSQRLLHHFEAASQAVSSAGSFEIVHSQHLPVRGANVVTFHNHTAGRLLQVGYGWEQWLIRAKLALIQAYKLRDRFDRMLCADAATLIFPAHVCKDDFCTTYGINATKTNLAIAYPGASLERSLTVERAPDFYRAPFTFLFVGKGFRKKGLDVLLAACKILKGRGKDFRLLIAGLKEKRLDSARLALLRLSENVSYLGFCSDMHAVYARASAIVLPSRIEPFGMAPLQGAAAGLVPIVSQVCGAAEVLTDGVDSLILKDHLSADELAGLMQALIDDRDLTDKLAAAAKRTSAAISWDETVQSTVDAYDATLAILKS